MLNSAQVMALIGVMFTILVGLIAYLWKDLKHRVDKLTSAVTSVVTDYAAFQERINHAEEEIKTLRKWKEERADPHITAVAVLTVHIEAFQKSMERLEKSMDR